MRWLERLVYWLEWLAAALLILLAALSVISFFVTLASSDPRTLFTSDRVLLLLDEVLVLFLLIELIRMALAYLHHKRVVPVVLEAVLIALARKTVALDWATPGAWKKSSAIALLLLSVGATWFLIDRGGSHAESSR